MREIYFDQYGIKFGQNGIKFGQYGIKFGLYGIKFEQIFSHCCIEKEFFMKI